MRTQSLSLQRRLEHLTILVQQDSIRPPDRLLTDQVCPATMLQALAPHTLNTFHPDTGKPIIYRMMLRRKDIGDDLAAYPNLEGDITLIPDNSSSHISSAYGMARIYCVMRFPTCVKDDQEPAELRPYLYALDRLCRLTAVDIYRPQFDGATSLSGAVYAGLLDPL